ncbi:UvrABC system protein C [Methanimicrococcus hongohii]|uniref:UvrABC system protein C n=1 Tax=Methanimicrococcus hongohii TaxID=3028295 RepID=A0AA96UYS7_9EURY|nr:excinuclease ABC subunit UvrC [Methanimicrococcus sp. Hf6]WNY23127.1 UvrABC system protein C [Methanimicrococcus sp. Hf6]
MIDLSVIPTSSGCYIYRDKEDEIIYIGKAKNLKKRVSSYFQKRDLDPKTRLLVKHIHSVDFIITANEVEALILENTLIKKHNPKYNIDLKDSKSYAFIHISGDDFPRIGILRRATAKGKLYGPFVSAKERDEILDVVKRTFKLRSCRNMPKRPCLRYHIGNCMAPCTGNIPKEEYKKAIDKADSVLRGNSAELAEKLRTEMEEFAKKQEFEIAKDLRDQIYALEYLNNRQHVARQINHDEDVINYIVRDGKIYIMVFNVVKGTLVGKEEFSFLYHQNFLEEFLVRYYSGHETPSEIILPDASEIQEEEAYTRSDDVVLETSAAISNSNLNSNLNSNPKTESKTKSETDLKTKSESKTENTGSENISRSLIDFLSQRHGKTVKITVPKRGDKKDLLLLAEKNIEIAFFSATSKVEELGKRLMLPEPPRVIECFDISHLSGTHTVASMVQFRDGKADKSNYRRFKIKTVDGINDFASIAEVVNRRYTRLLEEEKPLPDLIVIDGGKGQLSYAVDVLKKLGIRTPVISLAEREEEIFVPGLSDPLPIKKNEKASLYLQEIRDEAHRFAVTFNRQLREKALTD